MTSQYISMESITNNKVTSINPVNNTDLSLDELNNEFKMIQSGERRIAIIGTRNLSMLHHQVIETLAYALAEARNTIVTSGGSSGVNSSVIQGACKADENLIEVVLPQTLEEQSLDIRKLLNNIKRIEEHPERRQIDFTMASELCYREIVDSCHQIIFFLYHDSNILAKTVEYAQEMNKITTVFYLD